MTPDELWEKYANELLGAQRVMDKSDFLAALAEYGQAVRDRDAGLVMSRAHADPKNLLRTAIITDCAAAISREPLP